MPLASERAPNSKLSDEDRVKICKRRSNGETFQLIARDFAVGSQQVAFICRNWGPENGYPYAKKERPRKAKVRQRRPKIDLIGFENDHGIVVDVAETGYWLVDCKHCNRQHSQATKEIKSNAYTRVCPNFKHSSWSGLTRKDRDLRRNYGINEEQYQALRREQEKRCAICGAEEQTDGKRLSVDHDHASNKVRGLLCAKCNHAIGLFDDDPNRIEAAIGYLVTSMEKSQS